MSIADIMKRACNLGGHDNVLACIHADLAIEAEISGGDGRCVR